MCSDYFALYKASKHIFYSSLMFDPSPGPTQDRFILKYIVIKALMQRIFM